jgi:uncharacterized protein
MEIELRRHTAAGVPLLLAAGGGARTPLPTVLWIHGYGANKEVHEKELRQLARAGFLAVGLDAVGHGERRLPDLDAIIAAPRAESLRSAAGFAAAAAAEVPAVLDALIADGLADPQRLGLVGISMGGYAAYRAVVEEPRLAAVVALLGSPEWPHPASPHERLDAFAGTALLSITAERDENVPPGPARLLHQRLTAEPAPGRPHRYIELPGGVHLMNAGDWATTIDETLAWLAQHLLPGR